MRADVAEYFERYQSIPGWFFIPDFLIFDFILSAQNEGDIAEIGAYQGASAILLGLHTRPNETLTVCDLFGMPEAGAPNRAESESWYGDLTRESFERNYLSVLPRLPVIVESSSLEISDHVRPGSCRFVHIDGSHLYEFVRADILSARAMLGPDGVVALDDWCSWETPGVAAALMEYVIEGDLHTIAVTNAKFYGSWSESVALQARAAATDWAGTSLELGLHIEPVRGERWPLITAAQAPALSVRSVPKLAARRLRRALRGLTHREA